MRTKKKPDMHGQISMLGDNRDDNTGVPAVARVTDNARAAESQHLLRGRRSLWAYCNCNRKLFSQFIIIDCQQHRHVKCFGVFTSYICLKEKEKKTEKKNPPTKDGPPSQPRPPVTPTSSRLVKAQCPHVDQIKTKCRRQETPLAACSEEGD